MNNTEEIVRRYDRKRAVLQKLIYAEQIGLPLFFYSAYRFNNYISFLSKQPSAIFLLVAMSVCGIILSKNFYLLSVYGFSTTGSGKNAGPVRWRVIIAGILTGLLVLEAGTYLSGTIFLQP